MSTRDEKLKAFGRLLDIMDDLRQKCPWDKKQTIQSLSSLSIEEVYELVDAIEDNNYEEIKKELGDLMLHLVFYAKIASESNQFDVADVLNTVCDKLIFRHPHIYGDIDKELTEDEVKANWEKLKIKEGNTSVLAGVPKGLPSLVKAMRIQAKVKAVGFDWENSAEVLQKVKEELSELEVEIGVGNKEGIVDELGDVMFSLINYARFIDVDPDEALSRTNKKFIKRFQYIEQAAKSIDKSIEELTIDEMNKYWEQAKVS
ncbi:MAG: nucleoside triphosphate pyrophosphohydrolase [Flavobacteriales bacterium]|nr:nucleoside triphosphate pyrophosphohydrolase [Flavobacteriales bacterium]